MKIALSCRLMLAAWFTCAAAFAAAQDRIPSKDDQRPPQTQPFAREQQGPAPPPAAEAELRNEASSHPGSAQILYRLALLLREENKPRESLDTYTKAAGLQKPDARQLLSVALDYVLLSDYNDAIRWLTMALSMEPENVDVLYSLGRCLYTQNQFGPAEAAFKRALDLQPRHLKAEENLGLTYDAENKPQLAEEALRSAEKMAEQGNFADEWPYLDLGTFLLDQAREAEAVPFLAKAASIAPNSAVCHEKLGRALVAAGKVTEGVAELETATRLDPKNPKIHFELGHAYRASGDRTKAQAEFALSKSLYGEHNQN